MQKKYFIIFLSFFICLFSYSQEKFHFSTAFDGLQVDQNSCRLVSTSHSVASVFDRYNTKQQGNIFIKYEMKNLEAAKAEVVDAPGLDGKCALHFVAACPNVYNGGKPLKTRIQMEFVKRPGFGSFVSEVSVFLPAAMNDLNYCPNPITWLTLQEFWNALHGSHKTTFRITVGLWKSKKGKLHFGFKAQDYIDGKYIDVARGSDEHQEVPIGRWFRLKTEITEGDRTSGFFRLTLLVDGQEKVLYEQTMRTMSTAICEGRFPRKGFNSLQPIKLYTSAWLTEWMRDRGDTIEAYFTDWSFNGTVIKEQKKDVIDKLKNYIKSNDMVNDEE